MDLACRNFSTMTWLSRLKKTKGWLSKTLATLRSDIELPLPLDALALEEPDVEALRELFERFEFIRLLDELEDTGPSATGVSDAEDAVAWEVCRELDQLAEALRGLEAEAVPVLAAVGSTESALREPPVGLGIALGPRRALYVPVGHEAGSNVDPADLAVALEEPLGEGQWGGRDTKLLQVWFGEHGVFAAPPAFDTGLAAFLVDPAAARHTPALASAPHEWRRHFCEYGPTISPGMA